ncbi:hypothetical protein [Rathayibacter sp. VKM Ac-2805]|uniref:hypothetical protein n=1 Tax=Rathayibacter sp. VKM Ac-2805 TaxID=2609258 RepID=UPI00131F91AB|nr:hypothetical protein [Rathayibacter sp. VKM Ac-2805]QHC75146.1 hypothetical protein GSU40_16475 [Rathayibacter sp. VKM Ac-2805]
MATAGAASEAAPYSMCNSPLVRTALSANGMVWFGASVEFYAIADEQTSPAIAGERFSVLD